MESLICVHDLPATGESEKFNTLYLIKEKKIVNQIFEQNYISKAVKGTVSKVKPSLVGQYLYLQIFKPHQISADLMRIEFVGVNTQTFKLKKLKCELDSPLSESIEF